MGDQRRSRPTRSLRAFGHRRNRDMSHVRGWAHPTNRSVRDLSRQSERVDPKRGYRDRGVRRGRLLKRRMHLEIFAVEVDLGVPEKRTQYGEIFPKMLERVPHGQTELSLHR